MSYYDYLKTHERRYGGQPTPSKPSDPIKEPSPETSTLFDAEFTRTDLRKVLREWRLKNGNPIEREITDISPE